MWGYIFAGIGALTAVWLVVSLARPELTATPGQEALARSDIAKAGASALVLFGALAWWFWPATVSRPISRPKPPEVRAFEVGDLVTLFRDNEIAAERKFGRDTHIAGVVGKVRDGEDGATAVEISDPDDTSEFVEATLRPDQREVAEQLRPHDRIIAHCAGARAAFNGAVLLDGCQIQASPPAPSKPE